MRKKTVTIITLISISIILIVIVVVFNFKKIYKDNKTIIISEQDIKSEKIKIELINDSNIDSGDKLNENDNMIKEIADKKILKKEAEKRKILLSTEEEENIKLISEKNPLSEHSKNKMEDLKISEEEFRNQLYKELIDMKIRVKLKENLIKEINNNQVTIKNQEFEEKVSEYLKHKENNEDNTEMECLNLLNEYIELLENTYIVKEE